MDEQKVWIYVGKGEFIDGIPARDLTESDMARLDVDAQAAVENSKLYRHAPRKAEPRLGRPLQDWLAADMPAIAAVTTDYALQTLAVAALFILVLPLSLLVADSICTHWVHWVTSNPLLDHHTMRTWRDAWGKRLKGFYFHHFRGYMIRVNQSPHYTP